MRLPHLLAGIANDSGIEYHLFVNRCESLEMRYACLLLALCLLAAACAPLQAELTPTRAELTTMIVKFFEEHLK